MFVVGLTVVSLLAGGSLRLAGLVPLTRSAYKSGFIEARDRQTEGGKDIAEGVGHYGHNKDRR